MAADPRPSRRGRAPRHEGRLRPAVGRHGASLALLRTSRSGMVGLFLLVFFVLVAIFAPWIALQNPSSPTSFSQT